MATSDVQICNWAIAKIGHEPFIASLTEGSKAANFLNAIYGLTRDSLLRSYLWKFARKRAILAPLTETPAFDGGRYFQLPTDCLRVVGSSIDYTQAYEPWRVEGNRIVANTTSFEIVYTAQITDPSLFDAIFVDAFAARLAYEICMPLTQSDTMKDFVGGEYSKAIIRAAHAGATEQDAQAFISNSFISARN